MTYAPTSYSAIEIARTRAWNSPWQNLSPVKRGNDEPAKQALRAMIDSSDSRAFTFIPARTYFLFRSSLHSSNQ